MKQTILLTIVIILFLTSAFASSNQQEVTIHSQPDSPLQISNVVSKWRMSKGCSEQEWNMLTADVIFKNVSDKTIRAYTIRVFDVDNHKARGISHFSYTTDDTGLLKPNQVSNDEVGEYGFVEKSKSIKIAVDFVEFSDGSIWGEDVTESAQQLAGVRAGAEMTIEYLRRINEQNGTESAIKAIDEIKELLPPENKSAVWKRGFKVGITIKKLRIKRAYEMDGFKGAETELQKPFVKSSITFN